MVIEAELPGRGPGDTGLADYVSVETLSTGGRHRPVAVTGRLTLAAPFRERGGVMPAGLGQADLHRVTELAVAALDAIGVSDGVSHTEIKLQRDGARVIEVNGRLGGHIAWLWKRIGGGDLVALELAAACRGSGSAGRSGWPERPEPAEVVAFRYLLPAPMTVGRVRAVSGVAQARRLPGVELRAVASPPGDRPGLAARAPAATSRWSAAPRRPSRKCTAASTRSTRWSGSISTTCPVDRPREPMMRFDTFGSLRDLDAQEFDRLDASCGPVGCHARLVQLERDRRWSTEYLCAYEGRTLLAAVPLYRLRKGAWPDPSYDPATWGLDQPPGRPAASAQ